jgi:hypothetical protein
MAGDDQREDYSELANMTEAQLQAVMDEAVRDGLVYEITRPDGTTAYRAVRPAGGQGGAA